MKNWIIECDDLCSKIIQKYGDKETKKIIVDHFSNSKRFMCDLYGCRTLIIERRGTDLLCGGMKYGIVRVTRRPKRYFKKIIIDIECDIKKWISEHKSIVEVHKNGK